MSYGYRLNVEEVFFALAESKFSEATALKGKIRHRDPATALNAPFWGYPTKEGKAAVSLAVVSWATSLEAFTNLAWNQELAPKIPFKKVRQLAIRQLSTVDKLKELFAQHDYALDNHDWWTGVRKLFELRNRLVHYKDEVVYQGFSFASPIECALSEEAVAKLRSAAISCIEELGGLVSARTDFTRGDYEYETILT